MPANRIRADYDELMKLAGKWNQEAQSCAAMLQSLRQAMDTLQGGDWIGPGASAFYAEMNGMIIPALRRLIAALEQAAQCCRQLAELFKRAEDSGGPIEEAAGRWWWRWRALGRRRSEWR
jgi:WXG100 family type VII secretion target